MSAPESAAAVPVVEDVKPTAEMPAVEELKIEEPAVVAEDVSPAVEAEGTADKPMATEEVKDEAEKKDVSPKSSTNFLTKPLSKLFSSFNKGGEKKVKAPKKEKKKEEVEAPATMEAPEEVPAAAEMPAVEVPVVETVKEAEPVVTAPEPAVVAEEVKMETPAVVQKAEGNKAMKIGRRLSARVGDLFSAKKKTEVQTPAKVDELPPKIEEPVRVAPLENPASEAAKVEEPAKPVEVAAPVVTAAA